MKYLITLLIFTAAFFAFAESIGQEKEPTTKCQLHAW